MDPAVKSAQELNLYFGQLGIPCEVNVSSGGAGKYVVATADIPGEEALMEEIPLVSWPTKQYMELQLPFCFFCLRQRKPSSKDSMSEGSPISWSLCDSCESNFCSEACCTAARFMHEVLCPSLTKLRGAVATIPEDAGITPEALARCAVVILSRIAAVVTRQQLSHEVLQADCDTQHNNPVALFRQLFEQATAPFNRLISAPDGCSFAGVDKPVWFAAVRDALQSRGIQLLLGAAGSHAPALPSGDTWAHYIMTAVLREDTLCTLLGQLSLNAHAVTDFVMTNGPDSKPQASFDWVVKGAAVYTLLSAFNHSCEPNMVVTSSDGTHDIVVKATRPILKDEELCITYIPLKEGSTYSERRRELKSYHFTCQCPRCAREEAESLLLPAAHPDTTLQK